ncbi:MAG: helix-turn-helix domain-containing protein, partial [Desulfarculaceae bacterium]
MHSIVDMPSAPHGTRCIRRTVAIIKFLSGLQKNGATLSQIANKLSLPITTTKRILSVLVLEGFLSINDETKHYFLGHELVHSINKTWKSRFRNQYDKILKEIAKQIPD